VEEFDAVTEKLDLLKPEAVEMINDWVDHETHGEIQELITDPTGA